MVVGYGLSFVAVDQDMKAYRKLRVYIIIGRLRGPKRRAAKSKYSVITYATSSSVL